MVILNLKGGKVFKAEVESKKIREEKKMEEKSKKAKEEAPSEEVEYMYDGSKMIPVKGGGDINLEVYFGYLRLSKYNDSGGCGVSLGG